LWFPAERGYISDVGCDEERRVYFVSGEDDDILGTVDSFQGIRVTGDSRPPYLKQRGGNIRSLLWIDFAKITLLSQMCLRPPCSYAANEMSIPSIVDWDNQLKLLSGPGESDYSAASRSVFFRHEVRSRRLSEIAALRRSRKRNRGTRFPVSQNELNTDLCSWRHFDVRMPKIRGYLVSRQADCLRLQIQMQIL